MTNYIEVLITRLTLVGVYDSADPATLYVLWRDECVGIEYYYFAPHLLRYRENMRHLR